MTDDERVAQIREDLMHVEIRAASLAEQIEAANSEVYICLGHYRRARRAGRKAMGRARACQLIAMHGARQLAQLRAEPRRIHALIESLEYAVGSVSMSSG